MAILARDLSLFFIFPRPASWYIRKKKKKKRKELIPQVSGPEKSFGKV